MSAPYETDTRHAVAGMAQKRAHPNAKKYAARMGVSVRTAQRHRKLDKSAGSPLDVMLRAIDAAEPYEARVMLSVLSAAIQRKEVRDAPLAELIARYRTILAEDARHEGHDNALKCCRETGWLERMDSSALDRAHDDEKLAIEWEFHVRKVKVWEVFGG